MEHETTINGFKVRVRYTELSQGLEEKLITKVVSFPNFAEAEGKVPDDKELATKIRDYLNSEVEFAGTEGTEWHVIVGQHFVCSLKYEGNCIIFFDIVQFHKSVLAFKSG